MNDNSSKIEKGSVVRFVVIEQKFIEDEKDFEAIASLQGGLPWHHFLTSQREKKKALQSLSFNLLK